MGETIATAAGPLVQAGSGAGATTPAPDVPAADAVSHFDSAMQSTSVTGGSVAAQAPAPEPGPQERGPLGGNPLTTHESPGDRILRGLDSMNHGFQHSIDGLSQVLGSVQPGTTVSSRDLLRVQMAMIEVSTQHDLTGKVTGKLTQNLDTFLKNQ